MVKKDASEPREQLELLLNAFVQGHALKLCVLLEVVVNGESVAAAARTCGVPLSTARRVVEKWESWRRGMERAERRRGAA